MKTYPHVVDDCCRAADTRRELAALVGESLSHSWFAEYNLLHLQDVGERGVPDCYKTVSEFMCDFWPDLPWDAVGQALVVRLMLADPRWPTIAIAVQGSIGIDLQRQFTAVLRGGEHA